MKNLLYKQGQEFTATIESIECEGKIQIQGDIIYLCQNKREGDSCKDKLGYSYSWNVREGSEADLKNNDVKNLKIVENIIYEIW